MKKITLLLFCTSLLTFAQNTPKYEDLIPKLIQSPNAASLNKFIEFPVNNFNGTADVSFPLYEIKLKELSLPITLKYHTGGIRVNEEASWVGLGWALDVGGQITRQVNDEDDLDGPINIFGEYLPNQDSFLNNQTEFIIGSSIKGQKIPNKNGELVNVVPKILGDSWLTKDSEPDLYIYSMGGYSGKFIKDYSGNEIDLSNNYIKFKLHYRAGLIIGDSIIAVAPNGNIYKFKDRETGFSVVGYTDPSSVKPRTRTYLLSEIVTTNGEKVKFKYKTFKEICDENYWQNLYPDITNTTLGHYFNTPSIVESHVKTNVDVDIPRQPDDGAINNTWEDYKVLSYDFMKPLFLDKIEYPSGSIEFKHGIRQDNYGVKLDRISIKNNKSEVIKYYNFNYDYFVGTTPNLCDVTSTQNYSTSFNFSYPRDFVTKRLKLLSFSENGDNALSHKFNYNNAVVPLKTSFEQDFWGYYNGKSNKTLLPSPDYSTSFTIPNTYNKSRYEGANRDVDTVLVKMASLKEIIYPTGGKTIFNFESHRVINFSIAKISPKNYSYITALDVGDVGYIGTLSNPVVNFTFNEGKNVKISVYLTDGKNIHSSQECNGLSTFYAQIEKYTSSGWNLVNRWCLQSSEISPNNVLSIDFDDNLSAGQYRLTASYPNGYEGSFGSSMAQISVKYELPADPLVYYDFIGGLRLKEIKHQDTATSSVMSTSYSYSNGILATYPSYTYSYSFPHFVPVQGCWGCACTDEYWGGVGNMQMISKYSFSAAPIFPFSYSANGSPVGYRNVTETKSAGEIGRTEYEYQIDSDSSIMSFSGLPGLPSTSKLNNGLIKSILVYDKENKMVNEKKYDYLFQDPKVYWAFRMAPGIYEANGSCFNYDWMTTYFYPILKGKYVLDKITEINKFDTNELTLLTDFDYKIATLPFPTSTIKNRSDGKVIRNDILYSPQYNDIWNDLDGGQRGAYQDLVNQNRIVPIQESSYVNNEFISSSRINYKNWNYGSNAPLISPESIVTKNKGQAVYETLATFNSYDVENGNLLESQKKEGIPISYIWGYNKTQLVAKVENATQAEITALSLDTILINNSASTDSDMQTELQKLRAGLPKAMVTTYTYKPLVGVTSITDQKGETIYYKYDSFNRLEYVTDKAGNVLSKNAYNYQH